MPNDEPKAAARLRQRAEERAQKKAALPLENLEALSLADVRQALHELQVYQIELEMQNEVLRRTQSELEAARERFFDLYNLAPVGYITLSEKRLILESNLTAAGLLGITRGDLLQQALSRFILKEDQDIYYRYSKQLFETNTAQNFELRMVKKDGAAFWVRLMATAVPSAAGAPLYRVVLSDITERKHAEDEIIHLNHALEEQVEERTAELATANHLLEEKVANLRALSQALFEVQENERRRLALELHDELGQILSSIKIALDMIPLLPQAAADGQIQQASTLIGGLITRVSQISLDLRPSMLDDMGLLPALRWLFKSYQAQTGEAVTFNQTSLDQRFSPLAEMTAYRIVQQALTNVMRHAGNKQVNVNAWADQQSLNLQIVDHGVGFDPAAALSRGASSGLSGMRERARLMGGDLIIESSPGAGTRLSANLPLAPSQNSAREARFV